MRKAGIRALSVFFAAAVMLSASAVKDIGYNGYAYAEDIGAERVSGNFKYTVSNGEAEITGWATDEWELDVVDIPSRIDGYPVVSIGENAFRNKMIRSLKLPQGLREIKNFAFGDMIDSSIEVPETVTVLGEYAFGYSLDLHHMGYLALPSSLEFEPDPYSPMRCTILRYHTENGKAVIDSYELGDGTGYNLYVPETICSFDVQSVKEFTYYNDHSWFWENVRAVFCKNGVSLPNMDKIEVRYTPDGDGAKITSVMGNYPDITLDLTGSVNGRTITGIGGVTARLNAIAVLEELDGSFNVSYPVLYCKYHGYMDIVKIALNSAQSLVLPSDFGFSTVIMSEDLVNKVTVLYNYCNKLIYKEVNGGVEITDIVFGRDVLFIPTLIDGKPVLSLSDDCPKDFYSRDDFMELYIPAHLDSDEVRVRYKFVYIENSDSVSVMGYVIDSWASGGWDFEYIFGKPVDTVVTESGLWLGVNTDKDKNLIRYKKDANGNYEIIEIKQGDETSTVTIPETIGGVPVSGFAEGALDDVTDIIVPESLADSVPDTVEKVVYEVDEDGNFVITDVSENADVKFPESVGGSKVDAVIIEDGIKDKVEVPETSARIVYTEDEDGNVTITEITPAQKDGKDLPVDIPTINGKEPALSDQAKKQLPHNHTGGWSACQVKATCEFCGEEYGGFGAHVYEDGVCRICGVKEQQQGSDGSDEPENNSTAVVAEELPENVTMKVSELSESSEIAEYLKTDPEWNLIRCFNIELFENETQIYDLDSKIRLRFEVPEEFRAEEREFAVLRLHGSSAELLYDIDESDNTVTVETDKFSVYALVYRDAEDPAPDTDSGTESKPDDGPGNPDTGRAGVAWFILAGALSAAAVTVRRKKTK